MQDSKSIVHEYPQAVSDSEKRFDNSLQELRDLRSQLYYAADYCEEAFLTSKKKRIVLENTKEYLCRAVVTVVDHLGCVSANLDYRLSESNQVSETELRIDCLKQVSTLY
ncbi:unnamed protein product [Ilex paraguariensis]|uniref:Uncharacterized protein n=1 Tax=Ilex paraguariensis TaxID=185542 RepID=A0ABC8UU25_9AQUA